MSTPSGSQCATSDVRRGSDSNSSAAIPDLVEQLCDVLGGLSLPRACVRAEVGGVDPDQVLAQVDDLGFGQVIRAHRFIFAHGIWPRSVWWNPSAGPYELL